MSQSCLGYDADTDVDYVYDKHDSDDDDADVVRVCWVCCAN